MQKKKENSLPKLLLLRKIKMEQIYMPNSLPIVLLLRKIDALAAFENLAATAESRWKRLPSNNKNTRFLMFDGKL